jgi:hypothetical protein
MATLAARPNTRAVTTSLPDREITPHHQSDASTPRACYNESHHEWCAAKNCSVH